MRGRITFLKRLGSSCDPSLSSGLIPFPDLACRFLLSGFLVETDVKMDYHARVVIKPVEPLTAIRLATVATN